MAPSEAEASQAAEQPASRSRSRASSVGAQYREGEYDTIEDVRTTSLYSALSGLLTSGKFSDMIVRCGGREFKAHRAIVCPQSPFFDRAITGGFSESTTGVVELPDDDPNVLERFLQFLYTGNYEDETILDWHKPAEVSMMTPEEVAELLAEVPGVSVTAPAAEQPLNDAAASSSAAVPPETAGAADTANPPPPGGNNDDDSDTEDGSYRSRLSNGEPDEPDEPAEEYNEFDAEDPEEDSSTDDHRSKDQINRRHSQLLRELGDSSAAERQLLNELRTRQSLFLPLRLYVMADKFDVPALKLLARDRFYRAAELAWREVECFPDVVDELYTTTPASDLAMREIVCRLVGCSIKDDEQRERMAPVMRKHGDFAVGVLNYFIESERHVWT
ncbi:uncharacterized protein P884DRAFT_269857 [Thermothelomyces heterothallicus CBS 202.75]|uniref:uncharacterized protein n=1 Tax=Thermothelomyces heterothallicus CBS 202.75 TaxID=1149848 RepID=UPI003742AB9B